MAKSETSPTRDQDSTEKSESQPKEQSRPKSWPKADIDQFPPPRAYDTDVIDRFLDAVFHAELDEDENILTWKVKPGKPPGYPVDDQTLLTALGRSKQAMALYFGTSTCRETPEGDLRNRQSLFQRLHVVVLDDIGTKVPLDKLPQDFLPTYIIESSEGNFQYGYVLKEPVDKLDAANALVQMVYDSGLSDGGGKMPTKLVRLPEGVNGKPGEKRDFVTRLVELHPERLWTPQGILDVLNIPVKWTDVLADAQKVERARAHRTIGASSWSPIAPIAPTLDGVIDPVLEWLYENDRVIQDNGDWVTIVCPWHREHSDGNIVAGYSPIGRGDRPDFRGFKCFHDHCKDNNTREFLDLISEQAGIEAGITDTAARLCSEWVFDASADGVWKIKGLRHPMFISMSSFQQLYPHSVLVSMPDGRAKLVKETAAWSRSPMRVSVFGQTFDPGDRSRIVEVEGHRYLNTFSPPEWGAPIIDPRHVDRFTEFLTYLIPGEEEREYFLDWLAAKAQDMGFRGPAILMIARQQGTGRTTLTDMIATLFERENLVNIPFDKIIGDGEFNEWMESPIVVSDETLNTGDKAFYRAYERLKEMIDPRPKLTTINPKYGRKRRTMVHSSFLFLSNHVNAIALASNDRRFYVLENAARPARPEFFTALNEWLRELDEEGRPAWAASVWHWLQEREFNMESLVAPPAETNAKRMMAEETRSQIEILVEAVHEAWPDHGLFSMKQIEEVAEFHASRVDLYENPNRMAIFRRLIRQASTGYHQKVTCRVNNRTARPRWFLDGDPFYTPDREGQISDKARAEMTESMTGTDLRDIIEKVGAILDLNDL